MYKKRQEITGRKFCLYKCDVKTNNMCQDTNTDRRTYI